MISAQTYNSIIVENAAFYHVSRELEKKKVLQSSHSRELKYLLLNAPLLQNHGVYVWLPTLGNSDHLKIYILPRRRQNYRAIAVEFPNIHPW